MRSSLKRTRKWYQTVLRVQATGHDFSHVQAIVLEEGGNEKPDSLTASAFFIYDRSNTTVVQPLIVTEQLQDMLQGIYWKDFLIYSNKF